VVVESQADKEILWRDPIAGRREAHPRTTGSLAEETFTRRNPEIPLFVGKKIIDLNAMQGLVRTGF
jgi:hypothetical protein